MRTPPIFSLKDGREKLDLAEINGFITSEEKSNLLHDLNGSGIPEDGPDKKAIESYRKKQEEYEKKLNELFSKLGTPLNQAIRIPIASLNAPKE
ncbi:hypothetical protein K8R32_01525 [bacterium]|nr:hypothetical protein [bacterium]